MPISRRSQSSGGRGKKKKASGRSTMAELAQLGWRRRFDSMLFLRLNWDGEDDSVQAEAEAEAEAGIINRGRRRLLGCCGGASKRVEATG